MGIARRTSWTLLAGLVSLAGAVGCSANASGIGGGDDRGDPQGEDPAGEDDAGKAATPPDDGSSPPVAKAKVDAGKPASVTSDAGPTATPDAGPASGDAGTVDAGSTPGATAADIVSIALANVGEGACSANSGGGTDFESSCTGNDGSPEYWCADFVQWVWEQAGVDTEGLDAAAGSFYTYGQNFGTLHSTPSLGDAVVFNYQGGGYADHVAIVIQVNADGTIETVSGDWNGDGDTEAAFSSTSLVVLNTPAYTDTVATTPGAMGMTIAGYISPAPAGASPLTGSSVVGTGCYSDTLAKQMEDNACVQSSADSDWYQCDDGQWDPRASDPWACNGQYPL